MFQTLILFIICVEALVLVFSHPPHLINFSYSSESLVDSTPPLDRRTSFTSDEETE